MLHDVRQLVTYDEDIYREGNKAVPKLLRVIGVAAVLSNPWRNRGFVEDPTPEINHISPIFGNFYLIG